MCTIIQSDSECSNCVSDVTMLHTVDYLKLLNQNKSNKHIQYLYTSLLYLQYFLILDFVKIYDIHVLKGPLLHFCL